MLKRIQTLHKLWKLTNKNEKIVEKLLSVKDTDIDKLSNKGNGKAVFIADMNEDEYNDYVKNELNGWKEFTNKIKQVFK